MIKIKENENAWVGKIKELPHGYDCLGSIDYNSVKGLLIRKSGQGRYRPYYMLSHGELYKLNGNKIGGVLGTKGRPKNLEGMRMTLTLDQKTIDKAKKLGNGNISAGLRAWGAK